MPLYTYEQLLNAQITKSPSLIGDMLLPERGSLLMIAETEAGKSVIAFDMAICLALGKPLWGAVRKRHGEVGKPFFPIHRSCRVLYIDTELGEVGSKERLSVFHTVHCEGLELGDNLQFVTGDFPPLLLHNKQGDPTKYLENFDKLFTQTKPDVVFFDPLAQFHEMDENSNQMNTVLRNLKALQNRHKFAAVLIHHESDKEFINKDGVIVTKADTTARSRGHSSISAWADTVMRIHREDKNASCGILKISWPKMRHSRKPRVSFCLGDYERMRLVWICNDRMPNYLKVKADFLAKYRLKYPPLSEEEEAIEIPDFGLPTGVTS